MSKVKDKDENSMLSYSSLQPHIGNLRFCGYYPLDSNANKIFYLAHSTYMRVVLITIVLYTVQQLVKVYQVRDNTDKVMDIIFLFLTHTDSIYKQIVIWKKADKIEEAFEIMKGELFNHNEPQLTRIARQGRLLLRSFNYISLLTCLLWILYPVWLYAQGRLVEFAIWLPFDVNKSPRFYIVALYVWIQTSWLAYGNSSMDALMSSLLAQTKTQIYILRMDIENLVENGKGDAMLLSIPFCEALRRRFKKIQEHHSEIDRFFKKFQDIFGSVLLYLFLVSGWIICTTAYRIVNMSVFSMEFISMSMYMSCMLLELAVFCFYGNGVNHESFCIVDSAYKMDWLQIPVKQRKDIIIFMERMKRPITPMAGIFIPLSNATFVSIMRSSYSFYAFLKNTDD